MERGPRPVTIVTGGGRGIGAATARRLLHSGHDVVVNYRDDRAAAEKVVAAAAGSYGSSGGREDLIANVDAGNGSSATLKDARFSKLRGIGVGQQSFYESATIATKGSTLVAGFMWIRVGGGMAVLMVVAPRPPLADSVTIALAKTLAAHMTSVLGD
jgi:hypothetical protein